jgi:tRNA pseudouridine synthase 10
MGIDKVMDVLRKYPLCDHCLGRLFARLGFGLSNEERGRAIKDYLLMSIHEKIMSEGLNDELLSDLRALALSGHEPSMLLLKNMGVDVSPTPCYICGSSIFSRFDEWSRNIANALSSLGAEFKSFRLGTRVPNDVLRRELEITMEFGITSAESIKRELNRELGKRVSSLLGIPFSREEPDVEVVLDTTTGAITTQLMPLYLLTRYRRVYRLIGKGGIKWPINEALGIYGAQSVVIHSGGGEAGNVRVLGNGRPMIIQVIGPGKRPSIGEVSKALGSIDYGISLNVLSYVRSSMVRKVKAESRNYVITYRVLAITNGQVTDDALKSLHDYFRNRQVTQRLRWGGRVKKRVSMVYELDGRVIDGRLLELVIRCQGNLNIRGFVHGYFGDVEPSLSGVLALEVRPVEIDILNISDSITYDTFNPVSTGC